MRHSPFSDGRAPTAGNLRGLASVQLVIPRSKGPLPRRLRGVRGLRAQDHFLPLLVSATLLTTLALVCIAYFSLRADVLASQQQQVSRDVRIAQNMLTGPGTMLALKSGKLVAVSASGQAAALAGSAQVDSIRALTGERYALYQLQGSGLVAVAENGLGTVGGAAPIQAYDRLVADCGPLAPSSCHQAYVGTISLADGTYTAAVTPLFDANDSFIGALAVAQPQSAVLAPAAQFTVVLLFVGLLVTLVVLAAGVWTYNALSGEVLDALHLRLNQLATVACDLERAAGAQISAAHRQERMARQISEGARDIDALVHTMRQGHLSMHESASGVWAEMSQPGIAPDPQAAMRFARQAVVMAAHVGVTTEEARARCNHVVRLMNTVIAEGHTLTAHGRETELRAMELREVISHVERAIEEPLAPRAPSSHPLAPVAQLLPADSETLDEVAVDRDPADAPLAKRLARVVGAHALSWAHTIMSQALDAVERLSRRIGARLPECDESQPTSWAPKTPFMRVDPATRPAEPRERRTVARWRAARDSRAGANGDATYAGADIGAFTLPSSQPLQSPRDLRATNEEPVDARLTQTDETDELKLPRLIDLTRHRDRFPDRSSDCHATSDGALQPHASPPGSPPGSRGSVANEKPDDDENSWRLP